MILMKLNPTRATVFLRDEASSKKEIILIRIFEPFITSFQLLGKKDLILVSINLQSCVQLSIQSLPKGPLIL